jgi:hypothetical protein
MRFSVSVSAVVFLCLPTLAQAQHGDTVAKPQQRRANELTLAGLRPGKDTIEKARRLFAETKSDPKLDEPNVVYWNGCMSRLSVQSDRTGAILSATVSQVQEISTQRSITDCPDFSHKWGPAHTSTVQMSPRWQTGRKLSVKDSCSSVTRLYGKPDSRSPSTKGGQQLELLYYAFDWAGPDVPQVMEVLCTPEMDGKPGRVVEITLAAPSL